MAQQADEHRSRIAVSGESLSPKRFRLETGKGEVTIGRDGSPVEFFLGAVAGCVNSTGHVVAADMDMEIDALEVQASGEIDYATYKGVGEADRAGFEGIEVEVALETDADEETVAEWRSAVERRCPIEDNVVNETTVDVDVSIE